MSEPTITEESELEALQIFVFHPSYEDRLSIHPPLDDDGNPVIAEEDYRQFLLEVHDLERLQEACELHNILVESLPKRSILDGLRAAVLDFWFPKETSLPAPLRESDEEANLIAEYSGADTLEAVVAQEVLAIDDDEEDEDVENVEWDSESEDDEEGGTVSFEQFKRRVRLEENRRSEKNRRPGGIKTQTAMVKAHKEFVKQALQKGEIKDQIIDEHHLLLYIRFCAERPKKTSRGLDIPGTFIGASHIKKLYFGALRIRKEQEARNPSLKTTRPATSVHVWDSLKARMNEALSRTRNGLMDGEDAPDLIANTFLDDVTEEEMDKVGRGFLAHRELRSVVNGHLAWTWQNATGNRGDDIRALKLSETQPYILTHPDGTTKVFSILGLQGEEKAGNCGLRTKLNPVYSTLISHRYGIMCPLGALSFHLHYEFDVSNIIEKMGIDWTVNKSWRQIRLLHGGRSPTTPYNDQSLYTLYVRAFAHAGFDSVSKVHFPRRRLGYSQERLGVDPIQTAKLGWAVLGAHGYKESEHYDPIWTNIQVPEQFLTLVCPMAEEIYEQLTQTPTSHLKGSTRFWKMVISLCRYVFLCGAAIFQVSPSSNLFKLPALANPDVQNWMRTDYIQHLSILQLQAQDTVEFDKIQNIQLCRALEAFQSIQVKVHNKMEAIESLLDRRTAVLSPTRSYSTETYSQRYINASSRKDIMPPPTFIMPQTPPRRRTPESAVYEVDASNTTPSSPSRLRAYANEAPRTPDSPRMRTQVDLVLPPIAAFSYPNEPQLIWPPVFGQKSITWDKIFPLIKSPEYLWEYWGPSKTLETLTLDEMWQWYSQGEQVFNLEGVQTGIKPPLRLIEQSFQGRWRKQSKERKAWQRFREIPEYIESESTIRGISPQDIVKELEEMRQTDTGSTLGLCALSRKVSEMRKLKTTSSSPPVPVEATDTSEITTRKRKAPVAPRKRAKKPKTK